MNLVRYNASGYYFSPSLNTNSTPPDVAFGDYLIASPQYPSNGAFALYHFDTNGFIQPAAFPGAMALSPP